MKNLKARQFRKGDKMQGHGIIVSMRNEKHFNERFIHFKFDDENAEAIYPANSNWVIEEK